MSYENKTNEELIELLEKKDEEISELKQSIEEVESEMQDSIEEMDEQYNDSLDRGEQEEFAEKAFNAGYDACCCGNEQLRGWLNYKVEARL